MAYSTIILETKEGIATLILSRPEKLNAFNELMTREFVGSLAQVEQDKKVRALVITGVARGFCSGADIP